MAQLARGIRNNNPGNLRRSNDPWQGLSEEQSDPGFFTFKTAPYGLRAMAVVLIRYQDRYGLRTPKQVIGRWAPRRENDTDSYVASVCEQTGFTPDQQLDLHSYADLRQLLPAIVHQENGCQPYAGSVYDEALRLAGVTPPAKPLLKEPAVALTTLAAASTTAAQVATNVSSVWETLAGISPQLPHYLVIGLGATAVLAVAYFLVDRLLARWRGIV